jgi:2-succinyl-5-enolpyruvyl-6-hydroxy-3-cyclohexene-1-carboxylate synthase
VPSILGEPEVIVRLGAPLASKVLSQWLASTEAVQVLVDRDGIWRDPEGTAIIRIPEEPSVLCRALLDEQLVGADDAWMEQWRRTDDRVEAAIGEMLTDGSAPTEPGIARAIMRAVPDGAHVVVSSSMPIRDLEWFAAARDSVTVHANRGANGIDGVVSTAVGVAASGVPTALLIGDVAFLHDTNGLLGLAARGLDLCLVVIDNDGGGIFSFLPQRDALAPHRFEQLFGTPHGVDLTALANAHGLAVLEATDDEAAAAAISASMTAGGAHLVLVHTDRDRNTELHARLHAATQRAVQESLRGG